MRLCYIDAFSGIAGDMTVGALLDAGADFQALEAALASLGTGVGGFSSAGVIEHRTQNTFDNRRPRWPDFPCQAARTFPTTNIWNAHAASAREAGVSGGLVDALRERKELPAMPDDETAVVRFGQEFFRTHRVSRGTFQLALESLGQRGAIELALFLGNYASLALLVNSFDGDLPSGRKEPLLPV